jgi:RNA polymerase sigma-70 factor (ECF subfamily)
MQLEARVRELLAADEVGEAATRVIEEIGPYIGGYLVRLHGEDDGADVYSSWAEDVWSGIQGFRFEAPLRAWAYRVAWNASARFRRDAWRRRRQRLRTSAASRLPAPTTRGGRPPPLDERLQTMSKDLDPADYTLLILRLDREMSFEDISTVLSQEGRLLPAATLRKRYERLKDRLAQRVRRRGAPR